MSAKNIMIHDIDTRFTAEYIANVLWKREIAKVSSITLIPQIKNEVISNIAYIYIDSFCDTEDAYEFIKNTRSDYFMFCHDLSDHGNNLWTVQKNTHNSNDICVGSYTTTFKPDYFDYEIVEAGCGFGPINPNYDEEEEYFIDKKSIKGLNDDYYSLQEALEHIWELNERLNSPHKIESEEELIKIEEELIHFGKELRFHNNIEDEIEETKYELDFLPRHHPTSSNKPVNEYNNDTEMRNVQFKPRREIAKDRY